MSTGSTGKAAPRFGNTGGTANAIGVDTIVLAPGEKKTLSPQPEHFATPGVAESFANGETWSLEPGTWKVRACVFAPAPPPGPSGPWYAPVCGQDVSLTITQQ
jgi:hypothetical protein